MRIGILTGGGDVPGLNPCIKAIVTAADALDWEVVGFLRGWAGVLNFDPDNDADSRRQHTVSLDVQAVRDIDRTGGTMLHTSRTNPSRAHAENLPPFLLSRAVDGEGGVDCTDHILRVIEHLGLDAMIPIGGDDTLSYAVRLHQEGVPIVTIPKTMDNDVHGTQYCIGFSTAVTRSVDFINALRTPTGSHERIAVIELFGRNSGQTALLSGHLAYADRVLIPEVPFELPRLAEMVVRDRADNPANYAVVVVSEGAHDKGGTVFESGEPDAYGHRKLGGAGAFVGQELKKLTGVSIINQSLAYLIRAGAPDALDKLVATSFGTMAIQHLRDGNTGRMIALVDGRYTSVPVAACVSGKRRVDIAEFYDSAQYRPDIHRIPGKPMFMY